VQDSAKRMQVLVQDLLTFSRTSTSERKFENIELNQIIDEVKAEELYNSFYEETPF
jgi:signal transduction histidine kinase